MKFGLRMQGKPISCWILSASSRFSSFFIDLEIVLLFVSVPEAESVEVQEDDVLLDAGRHTACAPLHSPRQQLHVLVAQVVAELDGERHHATEACRLRAATAKEGNGRGTHPPTHRSTSAQDRQGDPKGSPARRHERDEEADRRPHTCRLLSM